MFQILCEHRVLGIRKDCLTFTTVEELPTKQVFVLEADERSNRFSAATSY